jgi:hypothetical protein
MMNSLAWIPCPIGFNSARRYVCIETGLLNQFTNH